MTKEEQESQIAGLLRERRGYLTRGLTARVAAVDEQLRRLGAAAEKPSTRATRRGTAGP